MTGTCSLEYQGLSLMALLVLSSALVTNLDTVAILDAVGLLARPFVENGGILVEWPTDGYDFDGSVLWRE